MDLIIINQMGVTELGIRIDNEIDVGSTFRIKIYLSFKNPSTRILAWWVQTTLFTVFMEQVKAHHRKNHMKDLGKAMDYWTR